MCNNGGMKSARTARTSATASGRSTSAAVREIAGACYAVRVRMLSRAVSAVYERVMGHTGFSIAQVNLMVAAGMHGPSSPGKLGRSLHMERSTVSRNLERLLERGLMVGGPEGGERVREVALTPAGEKAIEEILPLWRTAQEEAAALLGEPGAASVRKLGARLFSGVRGGSDRE